jgi:hypothetical protein
MLSTDTLLSLFNQVFFIVWQCSMRALCPVPGATSLAWHTLPDAMHVATNKKILELAATNTFWLE